MMGTTVVLSLLLLGLVNAQDPQWRRTSEGLLYFSTPDIGGLNNVTVSVQGDDRYKRTVFIPQVSADNSWRTVIADVTGDAISYVIEYAFGQTTHLVTGTHSFKNSAPSILNSEHHLRRRGSVVFSDDFSSGHIDNHKWKKDSQAVGLGFTMYSPEDHNSYVKNGHLYICPTLTTDRFGSDRFNHGTIDVTHEWGKCDPNWGHDNCVTSGYHNRPVISASLRSINTGHIKYGKVEVRAKLPKGDWLWPGIWMMPVESHYGGWPKSGEMDIMEQGGNMHMFHPSGQTEGAYVDHSTIHYGTGREGNQHHHQGQEYRLQGRAFGDDFHTFWLDWNADHIRIGVDGHTSLTVNTPSNSFWNDAHLQGHNIWANGGKNAPFDRPFYLILNVAVGGGFFWNGLRNEPYGIPWTIGANDDYRQFWNNHNKWLPTWKGEDKCMKVDSVKMTQY